MRQNSHCCRAEGTTRATAVYTGLILIHCTVGTRWRVVENRKSNNGRSSQHDGTEYGNNHEFSLMCPIHTASIRQNVKRAPHSGARFTSSFISFAKHTQNAGDNLLSPFRSTIGSRGLDCRVRNGNGYDPSDKSPAFWVRSVELIQVNKKLRSFFLASLASDKCTKKYLVTRLAC